MEKLILYGVPVYTSNEMKEQLKVIIQKHGSPSSKKLVFKFINDGNLTPIINEPNKLKQLMMKVRRINPIHSHGFAGNGGAYVLFDPNLTSKIISNTALHELVHLSHIQFPKEFHSLNMPLYVKFYTYFYKHLFEANGYDKKSFIKFLKAITQPTEFTHWDVFEKTLYNAFKDYTSLPHIKFKNKIELIQSLIDNNWYAKADYYNVAIATLRSTYRHLFKGMDYTSGMGQELWKPGEIIAILSTINPDHPNVIKSLKLIKPNKDTKIQVLNKKIIKGH